MQILSSNHATHSLGYQIIFCPKYRHQILTGAVEVELKHILIETCKAYGWLCHSLEVMSDHVHIFVQVNHKTAPVQIAQTLKSISAVHLFNKFPEIKQRKFWGSGLWSKGTYYASVGHISEDAVKKYIETQTERN
jgi:putative transposase